MTSDPPGPTKWLRNKDATTPLYYLIPAQDALRDSLGKWNLELGVYQAKLHELRRLPETLHLAVDAATINPLAKSLHPRIIAGQ
jgi:hypothetical protein